MKKLIILCLSLVTLFVLSSCKKDTAGSKSVEPDKTAASNSAVLDNSTQNSTDNITKDNTTTDNVKVDMAVFKDGLSSLKNPQYDMVYKLLERGVNAQLESDVTIEYPNYARRLNPLDNNTVTIEKGATPLGIAAFFCSPKLVNSLLQNGADTHVYINGINPVGWIVQCDIAEQLGMLENYLNAARKVERADKKTYTNDKILSNSTIICKTEDNETYNKTILNYAVENNLTDTAAIIIKYAGGINYTNKDDKIGKIMPIVNAAYLGKKDMLDIFLKKTGSFNNTYQPLDNGKNILLLDYIFYLGLQDNVKGCTTSKDFFKSIIKTYNNKTGVADITKLLDTGADTALKEELALNDNSVFFQAGSTAAHIAAYFGYDNIIKGLSLFGADLNMTDSLGRTPLHLAALTNNYKTVKTLLESGVNPNIKDNSGNTPLMTAALYNKEKDKNKVIKVFLNSPYTDFTIKNNSGQSIDTINLDSKELTDLLTKYNTENRRDYSNLLRYSLLDNKKLYILSSSDINNISTLSSAGSIKIEYPEKSSPLIAAALACNDEAVKSLILLGADLNYRVKSKDDTVLNAYDFADRYTDKNNPKCVTVIEYLKNPDKISKTVTNVPETNIDNSSNNESNTVIEVEQKEEKPKDPIDVEVNLE